MERPYEPVIIARPLPDITTFISLTHAPQHRPKLSNWWKTYGCTPELLFLPVSAAEVQTIVREAARQSRRVRAVGEHNSPSECWTTDDWMIVTRYLRTVDIDIDKRHATLGAGWTLRDAHPMLYKHGLSFPVTGSIPDVSIGAAFCESLHGTGLGNGVVADSAVACVLVTASGELVRASRGENTHNGKLFDAAACGMGLCGLILEVTFALEPTFDLLVSTRTIRLSTLLDEGLLLDIAGEAEQVKLWNFPGILPLFQHDTIVWSTTKVPATPARVPSALGRIWTAISAPFGFALMRSTHLAHALLFLVTTHLVPALQPAANTFLFALRSRGLPTDAHEARRSATRMRGYEAQTMDCLYSQVVNEWAVPFGSGVDADAGAVHALRALIALAERTCLHAPLELRFGGALTLPLSPTYSPDPAQKYIWLEPIVYRPFRLPTPPRYLAFFEAFEQICQTNIGRSHASKAHKPFTRERKERGSDWATERKRWDGETRWTNGWLDRHWEHGSGNERLLGKMWGLGWSM